MSHMPQGFTHVPQGSHMYLMVHTCTSGFTHVPQGSHMYLRVHTSASGFTQVPQGSHKCLRALLKNQLRGRSCVYTKQFLSPISHSRINSFNDSFTYFTQFKQFLEPI